MSYTLVTLFLLSALRAVDAFFLRHAFRPTAQTAVRAQGLRGLGTKADFSRFGNLGVLDKRSAKEVPAFRGVRSGRQEPDLVSRVVGDIAVGTEAKIPHHLQVAICLINESYIFLGIADRENQRGPDMQSWTKEQWAEAAQDWDAAVAMPDHIPDFSDLEDVYEPLNPALVPAFREFLAHGGGNIKMGSPPDQADAFTLYHHFMLYYMRNYLPRASGESIAAILGINDSISKFETDTHMYSPKEQYNTTDKS